MFYPLFTNEGIWGALQQYPVTTEITTGMLPKNQLLHFLVVSLSYVHHLYSVMNTEQYEECIHVSGRSSEEIKPVILSIVELHLAKEISVSQ